MLNRDNFVSFPQLKEALWLTESAGRINMLKYYIMQEP